MRLQWGRAGGHGSGLPIDGVARAGQGSFNGAVPGGTDREGGGGGRQPEEQGFNGAVPGGTDRAAPWFDMTSHGS